MKIALLSWVSVITEFDGLLVKFCDGCYGEGQGSKANGTGKTTGAVLELSCGW